MKYEKDLMTIFDNVCKTNSLHYWFDFSPYKANRNNNFDKLHFPIKISMMRQDYEKLWEKITETNDLYSIISQENANLTAKIYHVDYPHVGYLEVIPYDYIDVDFGDKNEIKKLKNEIRKYRENLISIAKDNDVQDDFSYYLDIYKQQLLLERQNKKNALMVGLEYACSEKDRIKKNRNDKKLKILVVRYGTIGDTIFCIPFFRELRKYYGNNCQIDAMGDNATKEIFQYFPYIDKVISTKLCKIDNFFHSLKILKTYDKIYFLRKDSRLSIFAFLAGTKERVGLKIKNKNKFLTTYIDYDESKHIIDLYLDLLRTENIPVENNHLENIFHNIKKYNTPTQKKYVAIQPFSSSYLKDWDLDKWCQVLDYITNKFNLDVIILGGKNDFVKAENLIQNSKNIYNLCGKTGISDSISIVRDCEFFIGVDSGLIHIASVFEKKSILLHGSTSLTHWKPQNKNLIIVSKYFKCSPCSFLINSENKFYCRKYPKCMMAITAEDVIRYT